MSSICYEPIFNCKNNYVLIQNFKKHSQQNKDISNRNFNNDKNLYKPILPQRNGFSICKKYIDLNDNNLNINLKNNIKNFNNIKTNFIPGKGHGINFLKNIDVDSELKSLNFKNTYCPNKKYIPISNHNYNISNPNLIDNPYDQNYIRYRYNDTIKINENNYIDQNIENNRLYKNVNHIDDLNNVVKINYIKYIDNNDNLKKYNTNCLDKKQLDQCNYLCKNIIQNENLNKRKCNKLTVGPKRTNHTCENLWNNITK